MLLISLSEILLGLFVRIFSGKPFTPGLFKLIILSDITTQRLRTAQRAMERKMLKAKLKDKIPCREIRAKTNIKDVVKFAAKQKWKWAGHVALNDNRWTKRITDWQPRYGKRSRGRQVKRWRDDIVQMKGITWGRDAGQRDDWRRDAEAYILQWIYITVWLRVSVAMMSVFRIPFFYPSCLSFFLFGKRKVYFLKLH